MMRRIASTLALLGGTGLLVMWGASSASSAPRPAARARAAVDEIAPQVKAIDQQVTQLRDRLDQVPDPPQPSRDPFAFGRRPEPARPAVAPQPEAVTPVEPPPTLPRLIAIVRQSNDAASSRSAVFSAGDDVAFVVAGERQGAFVVQSISDTSVVLIEPVSGRSFGLSLQ